MKKNTMLNRILSCGLALALFVASPVSVIADDVMNDASVETTIENTSEEQGASEGESGAVENTAAEETTSESGAASEDADQADPDDSTSENTDSEKEEVNTDDARAGVSTDKSSEVKTADEEIADEDETEASTDVIEYTYATNNDGTHTKTWTDENGDEQSETVDCEYDADGKCELCGYEKEDGKSYGIFEVTVDGFTVTADVPEGAFNKNVELLVDSIELTEEEKEAVDAEISVGFVTSYNSFDIRFEADGNEVEPDGSIKVNITSPYIEEDSEIVHIDDEGNAESIVSDSSDGEVEFEAESFSTYTIAGVNYEYDPDQVLYYNSAYGSAFSTKKFNANRVGATSNDLKKNNRYGLLVRYDCNTTNDDVTIAPEKSNGSDQAFLYTTSSSEITFVAPENYYIKEINAYTVSSATDPTKDEWKKTYTPSETYAKTYKPTIEFVKGKTVALRVSLEKIPTEFTSESTVVNGATIVNYVNSTNAFGNTFLFNYGSSSIDSNACHYGQVYQGLASSTIGTTFELATDNGTALFPGEVDNSYVTALYSNVGVQFKKDTDGYWTLDSKYYKYVYNSGNTTNESNGVIEANTGSGFWPFQVNGGNDIHYGMVMPISFRVNSDGTTTSASGDTEDTVFKFSGDDDVFVYVDGQLVLDLGGIHNAVYGQIDFKTGDILIQGYSADGRALTSSLDSTAYANESLGTKNLYEIVAENNVSEFSESNHVLTVVYFERGGNVSNCKISYNFVKNETTNVSYEGLKVERNEDGTYSPLEGATFTLYTDEECNNVAEMSLGGDAITTSDADGTILFENLSAGIADDNNQTTKTYYMKETAAPEGYDTPSEAIWKLVISYDNGTFTRILTAFNDSALAISLNSKGKVVSDSETEVKSIKNTKTPVAKELKVEKVVSDGTTVNPDPNARYVFYLGLYTGNDSKGNPLSTAVANKAYTVDNEEYFTDDEGKFSLKADEIAIFEELYGSKYIVAEVNISDSGYDYTLRNYNTRIVVDKDYTSENIIKYSNTTDSWRQTTITYTDDENKKEVLFENLFTKTTDNTDDSVLSKFITKNSSDDYDLTLTFKSPVYSSQTTTTTVSDNFEKAKMDIVVVFDLSNSMSSSVSGSTRLALSKTAIEKMVDSVNTDEVDVQWKLVSFGSYAKIETSSWVDSASLKRTVNNLSVYTGDYGGTNYQDALVKADKAVNASNRDDATQAVIFITDGVPTFHLCESHYYWDSGQYEWKWCNYSENYNRNRCTHTDSLTNSGNPCEGGSYETFATDYEGALMGAQALDCDYFYAVGIDLTTSDVYTDGSETLDGLGIITKVAAKVTNAAVSKAYNSSQDDLAAVLSGIAGSFGTIYSSSIGEKTYTYASSAVIVDELSQYVDIVENSSFSISVKDEDGTEVGVGKAGKVGESDASYEVTSDGNQYTFRAYYDSSARKVVLDIASADAYILKDYTYSVTFKVTPSAAAYSYISENESYPTVEQDGKLVETVGESGTGDSSEGFAGFYSNNSAYVTYTFKDGTIKEGYNKPVIQVDNVYDWQLIKISQNTGNALANAEFVLSVPGTQGAQAVYYGKSNSDGQIIWYESAENRDANVNMISIPEGTYTLYETKAPLGYAKSNTVWNITVDNKNGIQTDCTSTVTETKTLSNGVTKKITRISIANDVLYTLPETGGSGVYVYTIGGILLMLAGALLLYKNKNNKSNKKERNK